MLKMLLPLDGSKLAESAVRHALAMARPFSAHVTLLRVVTPAEFRAGDAFSQIDWRLRRHQAAHYLRGIADIFSAAGIKCDVLVKEGRPAEVIFDVARKLDTNLLVLNSWGSGEAVDFPVGGIAGKILSRFDRSVLLVRGDAGLAAEHAGREKRIIVPVDGSNRSQCTLRVASMLAESAGAALTVIFVASAPALPPLLQHDLRAGQLCREFEDLTRAAAERWLDAVRAQSSPLVDLRTEVLLGASPADAIGERLRNFDGDFVVTSDDLFGGKLRKSEIPAALPVLILVPDKLGEAFSERRPVPAGDISSIKAS